MVSRGLFDDMRQCTTGSDGAAPHPENGDMGQNALVLAAKFAHLLAPHYPVICDTTCTTLLHFLDPFDKARNRSLAVWQDCLIIRHLDSLFGAL